MFKPERVLAKNDANDLLDEKYLLSFSTGPAFLPSQSDWMRDGTEHGGKKEEDATLSHKGRERYKNTKEEDKAVIDEPATLSVCPCMRACAFVLRPIRCVRSKVFLCGGGTDILRQASKRNALS